ncbi:MAG: hypothetical protein JKY65_33430 [Planctomycetes bacterium]|nr:hypothetical protein [Planctomycetota bacterium]
MSDSRLRELERRWKETGSVDDEAAWLRGRVNAGEFSAERLEVLARIGHPAASDGAVPPEVEWRGALGVAHALEPTLAWRFRALVVCEVGLLWVEHESGVTCSSQRVELRNALLRNDLSVVSKGLNLPEVVLEEGCTGRDLVEGALRAAQAEDIAWTQGLFQEATSGLRNGDDALEPVCLAAIASLLLGYWVPSKQRLKIRYQSVTKTGDDATYASDPGEISLSPERLEKLAPEICKTGGLLKRLWEGFLGEESFDQEDVDSWRVNVTEQLRCGDSRAAVVISTISLIVAAYTDELDCVVLLRFSRSFVQRYGLRVGSRLLTVNRYCHLEDGMSQDLWHGEHSCNRYGNFIPYIADFLSEDKQRLSERKQEIEEREWHRCKTLGDLVFESGQEPRGGKPHECFLETTRLRLKPADIQAALASAMD